MSITYSWDIMSLQVEDSTDADGQAVSNSICVVEWNYIGTRDDGETAMFPGTARFSPENVSSEDFIPFENLTEEIVIGWLENSPFVDLEMARSQIDAEFVLRQQRRVNKPWEA